MCLGVGNLEKVVAGGPRRSQTCAETTMGFGGLFGCMCAGVYKEVFTSKLSVTMPPETHISSGQLQGSLGFRDSYRPMLVSEPSCCRDLHYAYMCRNFPSNRLPLSSVREGRTMRPEALLVFMRILCVSACDLLGQPCTYICLWFVSVLCV